MLRLHQIFIIKFLLLLGGALLVSSIISYTTLKNIIINHNTNHLKKTIIIMQRALSHVDSLDRYVMQSHNDTDLRITIISDDGIVIAESHHDKHTMDNHLRRSEIVQANQEEFGAVTRYSSTLKVDFLYVAKKGFYKHKEVYIRLSMSLEQVMSDFYSLWSSIAIAFTIIMIFSFYISKRMSARILYDINQITKYLEEISNKNYKAVLKTKYFQEFLEISLMLKNLAKKLKNRDEKKRKYTAKLRLVNRQRNDILSAISHEFKNPIASIMGYAQTLQADIDTPVKIRTKFLGKINSNANKISEMMDRLALSVKLENSDIKLKKVSFNLYALCEDVIATLTSKYQERKIVIDIDKEFSIYADATMMELVLINLVENALKYSEADVYIGMKDGSLYIQDQGIGIKKEHIAKITSKFYRVEKNTWDNSIGIGLAMVSYVLNEHSSSLEIKSEFGQGSTFSFSLENMKK